MTKVQRQFRSEDGRGFITTLGYPVLSYVYADIYLDETAVGETFLRQFYEIEDTATGTADITLINKISISDIAIGNDVVAVITNINLLCFKSPIVTRRDFLSNIKTELQLESNIYPQLEFKSFLREC